VRSLRAMGLLPLVPLMVAATLPAVAQTKMFKCIVDGHTVYQQIACPVIQPATEAPSAPPAASTSAGSLSPRSTKRDRPAGRPAPSASVPSPLASPIDALANAPR